VIVAGALTFGMGDKLTKGAGNNTLGVGGFALMPANMKHVAYTTAAETTIVLYGQGPVEFKYVNPADDPRNAKASTTRSALSRSTLRFRMWMWRPYGPHPRASERARFR
jgi:hypothetical protein